MSGHHAGKRGFTLVELLVSLAIAALLITGMVQLAVATTGAYRLQQNLGQVQERARFALQMIGREARQAGFRPQPWLTLGTPPALTVETIDALSTISDRVSFQRRSQRNCHENLNPETDGLGKPRYDLKITSFWLNTSGNLAQTCRYGPDVSTLTTQVNALGLVERVEAFQILYAEDSDQDGSADRWTRAGEWTSETNIVGIRVGLLLASDDLLTDRKATSHKVLDATINKRADGRLRRQHTATFDFLGRSG